MDLVGSVVLWAVCVLLCQSAGFIGSVWTRRGIDGWYNFLEKPRFTPPGYLIGIIWTVLFFLIGTALYLVIDRGLAGQEVALPLAAFAVQLALNVLWNYFFFGLRSPRYGLVEILVMWASIAVTIALFWNVSAAAGALLLPYIAWVSIATLLNASIVVLNENK